MSYLLIFLLAVSINRGTVSNAGVESAATSPAGTWTGDSTCMVKNSPCRD